MAIEWRVPLAEPDLGAEERAAVAQVLASRWLTMGGVTAALEQRFARYLDAPHAVAVSSGTAALHIATTLAGVGPGDEVITPSLTFVASVNAIVYRGARPVFADVRSLDDWTIDPDDVARKVTPATRAVLVVHYGGYLCDMDAILGLARERGLAVIEDAAHTPGARLGGRAAGTLGDAGCFSFYANKNLTTAEGGMLVTGRDEWADRARRLRSHGMTALSLARHQGQAASYDVVELGYSYRTSDVHSAIGLTQLGKLDHNNAVRADLVRRYHAGLRGQSGITVPFSTPRGVPAYHLFPILLDESVGRRDFMQGMRSLRVQTSIHFPPVHLFSWYREQGLAPPGSLPLTETVGRRVVTLPLYPAMGDAGVDLVVSAIHDLLG